MKNEKIYLNVNENDCGKYGKAFEQALKARLHLAVKVAKQGRTDLRKGGVCYEVKSGAGELGNIGGKLVKGSSMVVYVPVIETAVDENGIFVNLNSCNGYVLSRENFLTALEESGAIREKTSTAGTRKVTIQTFWNRKENRAHGKLLFRMEEKLEEYAECSLAEWLEMYE